MLITIELKGGTEKGFEIIVFGVFLSPYIIVVCERDSERERETDMHLIYFYDVHIWTYRHTGAKILNKAGLLNFYIPSVMKIINFFVEKIRFVDFKSFRVKK